MPRRGIITSAMATGLSVTAALGLSAQNNSAHAKTTKIGGIYTISVGGFPVARATLSLILEGRAYSARINMSTSGIAKLAISSNGSAIATGWLGRTTTQPAKYFMQGRAGKRSARVQFSMGSGNVRSLAVRPKLRMKRGRVPVTRRHRRGILDPVSAALVPVAGRSAVFGPAACKRTIPVFDGWTRFNVKLFYKGLKTVSTKGYSGKVVVCGARWLPVAGHRPHKSSVKYMVNNRHMEAWFAPAGGRAVLFPYRVSIRTKSGDLVVQANRLKVTGSKFASAR